MTATASAFQQNFTAEKKPVDIVEKDIRKWVDSVVEFKANLDKQKSEPPNLDKQKSEPPLDKHLKKMKKFKLKKKTSLPVVQINSSKNKDPGSRKNPKLKTTSNGIPLVGEKSTKKEVSSVVIDVYDQIKDSYKTLKLPQNWTSGISNGRVVFNRIKVTTVNAQQKVAVERSLVITKDRNIHILINGSEIPLINWDLQKVETINDISKAIRDIDAMKICDGPQKASKQQQNTAGADNKFKPIESNTPEIKTQQKQAPKKPRASKKAASKPKGVSKQKSFQK